MQVLNGGTWNTHYRTLFCIKIPYISLWRFIFANLAVNHFVGKNATAFQLLFKVKHFDPDPDPCHRQLSFRLSSFYAHVGYQLSWRLSSLYGLWSAAIVSCSVVGCHDSCQLFMSAVIISCSLIEFFPRFSFSSNRFFRVPRPAFLVPRTSFHVFRSAKAAVDL